MKRLFANLKTGILITLVAGVLVCASCSGKKAKIAELEKKLELKANFESNLTDSIYPYSVALIVFNEEDITGLGYSIGKDIYLTGYGCCQYPKNDSDEAIIIIIPKLIVYVTIIGDNPLGKICLKIMRKLRNPIAFAASTNSWFLIVSIDALVIRI